MYFLHSHTMGAIYFMNHEGLFQIIRIIFNLYICLNHCLWREPNQKLKVWWKAKRSKAVLRLEHSFYK